MKLGIITDIHEHVECLRAVLDELAGQVDQVVMVGDVVETGERIEETCQLLSDAGVIGVWGNHDFGLCCDVSVETRETFSHDVLQYMGSLKPRLEIGDCLFSHIEPWLDPHVLEDLWFFGGLPTEGERLDRIFGAVRNRLIFAGHYHRWMLASPTTISDWNGESSIQLGDGRHFVVVNALFAGHYAVLDTETYELMPGRTASPRLPRNSNHR
ncbi:Calcineurin-like phosphoesterase superfamily domain protein [Stieleria neptunia]|uniref:Calcineurin-like phosphoesterase superfamily domain protein n=1 Tax=Stieleria neptunia TaxID=2527979 RepID=A0A518HMY0_9BACT|nr:metallophosphoesterase family protein [Stieleria neptunia]QDV42204.1 Calcineurin-like phosphoesterase superfamily domain protein [Stieleria neptunia]